MYGKNKVGIKLQMSVGEYRKTKVKSIIMKNLVYLAVLLIGIYLGMSFLKRFERTYSAPTDDVVVKINQNHLFVSDNAQILNEEVINNVQKINQELSKTETKPQLMVITVEQVPENETIESFTNQIGNKLGIGNKLYNNGVIYLVSVKDRQARLEVGYGLEEIIPDSLTDEITDSTVKDFYKLKDFNAGIHIVTTRINELLTTDTMSKTTSLPKISFLQKIWLYLLGIGRSLKPWLIIVFIIVMLYFLWELRNAGKELSARLALVDMANRYKEDVAMFYNGGISSKAIVLGEQSVEFKAAKARLEKNILYPENSKKEIIIPAYYDMDFAFGEVTPKKFIYNYVAQWKDLRSSSMCACFWKVNQPWIYLPRFWIGEVYWEKVPETKLPACRISGINDNLIPAYLKIILFPLSILLKHPFLVSVTLIIYVQVSLSEQSFPSTVFTLITEILTFLEDEDSLVPMVSLVYFLIPVFFLFGYIKSIGVGLQNRLHLDSMIRRFLKDIQQVSSEKSKSLKQLANDLDNQQYKIEKKLLRKKIREKKITNKKASKSFYPIRFIKTTYPEYYDMRFAYGNVSIAKFLASSRSDRQLKKTSMYANRHDWWVTSNEGSSDDGSGDGFGGGSFGGGGGTSSW
ncbi:TPA: TPM domain-containing protein [Enterococcus faecalis]|uniref:TPM domain-containing protein n=1 Tax=Enterococcus TaxID=1350 RepID=UPI001573D6DE|nr:MULTISPECIES: TPM domain-containing protein [Enterococcus]EGO9010396.1 TPM domain-containing protein [Enterococcus faecalis]EHZ9203913.1 TPM domain-containing protein [Enterococcus faecalis]MBD9890368.1 TPM domain-containing protein [Enterococcus faecalis]MBD9927363.1 TPM domain-containing protein [Enterococcus faecalis]MDQ8608401.1 TPM domain-containing protein [Enterococcus sp. FR133]